MKDSLIVVSGGMDSITLLYEYADRIALAVMELIIIIKKYRLLAFIASG